MKKLNENTETFLPERLPKPNQLNFEVYLRWVLETTTDFLPGGIKQICEPTPGGKAGMLERLLKYTREKWARTAYVIAKRASSQVRKEDVEEAISDAEFSTWNILFEQKFEGNCKLSSFYFTVFIRSFLKKSGSKHNLRVRLVEHFYEISIPLNYQSPEWILIYGNQEKRLTTIVKMLSSNCEQIIRLKSEGYDNSEIVDLLGLNFESSPDFDIRRKVSDCRRRLRDLLEKYRFLD